MSSFCKCLTIKGLRRAEAPARKCLIINDLQLIGSRQKEAGDLPPPLLRFRFSLGDQFQEVFVTSLAAEDFEQVTVDTLAVLVALLRDIASQELSCRIIKVIQIAIRILLISGIAPNSFDPLTHLARDNVFLFQLGEQVQALFVSESPLR